MLFEQLAGAVVAELDAAGDAAVEAVDRLRLEVERQLQLLDRRLADADGAEPLQVGQAVEVQDALDELVGVLHLVDRLVAGTACPAARSPSCRTSWRRRSTG